MLGKLEHLIAGSDALPVAERGELAGKISMMPGPRRYLRQSPKGLLRIDKAKVTAEEKLDGKYLLRCSDPNMSAADIAVGYRQLIQVERGWRDLGAPPACGGKTHLELRPVYHRREDRIRAHVLLCWLSLLLVRIAETRTGRSWAGVREDLSDLSAVVAAGPAGTFVQSTLPTRAARAALSALGVPAPKQVLALATPTPAAASLGRAAEPEVTREWVSRRRRHRASSVRTVNEEVGAFAMASIPTQVGRGSGEQGHGSGGGHG